MVADGHPSCQAVSVMGGSAVVTDRLTGDGHPPCQSSSFIDLYNNKGVVEIDGQTARLIGGRLKPRSRTWARAWVPLAEAGAEGV